MCKRSIGGSGFVGQNLVAQLLQRQTARVLVYDCAAAPLAPALPSRRGQRRELYKAGNVEDAEGLLSVMRDFGPTAVVHLAGWGMSGPDMLDAKCERVNVEGTRASLQAAIQCGVESFIYLSTYNVVFHGQEIVAGDETMPYSAPERHTDCYSPSKAEAEKLVLAANGSRCAGGGKLLTCALRPAAIYGAGEQRHFPRIVRLVDLGLNIRIGNAIVDWVHVDNLVSAILLAHTRLASIKGRADKAPAGRAYFISDGEPVDNFDFLAPVIASRYKTPPQLALPVSLCLCVAWVMEIIHKLTGLGPLVTRAEVFKVGVTHHFSTSRAYWELGYVPLISSRQGAQDMAKSLILQNKYFFDLPHCLWWMLIVGGMALLALFSIGPELSGAVQGFLAPVQTFALWLFGSRYMLQVVLALACAAHVTEAAYAFFLGACFSSFSKCVSGYKISSDASKSL
jgi:nucleoside-diphosphate-sugar epimerase